MIFGLTFEKLLLLGVIAALLIGPERLPRYAESFARLVKRGGEYLRGAKTRMEEELGTEEELDWRKLDPRQYDPRRIIRDALFDDAPPPASAPGAPPPRSPLGTPAAASPVDGATAAAGAATTLAAPRPGFRPEAFSSENPPPFDSEAT